jgi:FixJ family two-component response regulator
MASRSLIALVDDGESVRESLPDLLQEFGFAAPAFASAEDFLASGCLAQTSCLVLDVAMPEMSGPDLHLELRRRRYSIPIVYVTAYAEDTLRPHLMEQGATTCLFKPFTDTELLEALQAVLRSGQKYPA